MAAAGEKRKTFLGGGADRKEWSAGLEKDEKD